MNHFTFAFKANTGIRGVQENDKLRSEEDEEQQKVIEDNLSLRNFHKD